MSDKSSIFDMIGPVMIGPSSSHTAGVVRIGKVAHKLLGGLPDKATITFYNSFARTYEGHGSDRAILSGLMGFGTDDTRIKQAYQLAEDSAMEFTFKSVGNANTLHPNTVRLELQKNDMMLSLNGESQGGGIIRISRLNGFSADFSATAHTLIVEADDKAGSISYITDVLAQDECNIATMTVSRKAKNDLACQIIEMDSDLRPLTVEYLRSLYWVKKVIYIPNIDL